MFLLINNKLNMKKQKINRKEGLATNSILLIQTRPFYVSLFFSDSKDYPLVGKLYTLVCTNQHGPWFMSQLKLGEASEIYKSQGLTGIQGGR